MKKFFLRSIIILIVIFSSLISYLSIIGIETNKLNSQISHLVKNINKDLNIELRKIKLVLDPFNFVLNAKTVGPKLKIKEKELDIQNIQTTISINSFLKNKFSLSNLQISTNSLKIENVIAFLRKYKNNPEFFILEKVIKKGYLISNINLEFDDKGNIKNNFRIKGFIKDGKLSLLKNNQIEKLDFIFDITKDNYQINDINLFFNEIPILSREIVIKKNKDNFLIEGSFENKDLIVEKKIIDTYFNLISSKYKINDLNFKSKNNFKFKLNNKLKINELEFLSKIKLNNLKFTHNLELIRFFPNIEKDIGIKDHSVTVKISKDKLSIKGSGNILLQEKEDDIEYSINKKNNQYKFKTSLLSSNPIKIDFLGYQKDENLKSKINLNGLFIPEKKISFNFVSLEENNNKFIFENLIFDNNFQIIDLEKVTFNYEDKDKKKNILELFKKKNQFYLNGKSFNADYLIENLFNSDNKNTLNLNKNFDLNIDIKKIYLDKNYELNMLNGNFNFNNNKVEKANLEGSFSNKEKFKFTINTKDNNKVTTLFSDNAEPFLKKYKFIKGFKNGHLDFYSVNNGTRSISTLKIYDFNLKELPILTKILTLASLQGIADILSGEGITFNEFEMNFKSEKNGITIDEIYAIGPAISILMDGYYIEDELISLRGTLVPATTINKFVGSIPVLGKILVGNKTGEGVFGVSFKIKGSPINPKTSVNPIKTLTPRFITRTLEKIKKN